MALPTPPAVIAAVIIMGDSFGPVNAVGLGIVIMGVLLFNWHKYRRIAHVSGGRCGELQSIGSDSACYAPMHGSW